MIPIIFDKSEPGKGNDAFKTNGLGRLSDAISCDVTKSLDGSQYDLDLEYPVTGLNYDYLIERNYIYTTVSHKYGPQPFRINKISKPIDGKVTVNAQHISYILKKTLIRPYLGESEMDAATRFRIHKGQTLQSVLDDMVNYIQPAKNRLFNFTTNCQVVAGMAFNPYDKTWYEKSGWGTGGSGDDVYYQIDKPISVQEFLTGDDSNSINSIFGFSEEDNTQLEYVFDGLTIALYAKVGVDSGISIRYGKDLTDLTYDVDIDDSYGYAIPYYSGSRTSTTIIGPVVNKNVDGTDAFGEIELIDLSSDETYGSYLDRDGGSETPTPANAADWISQKMADETPWVTKQNVTISFVELWKTEEYKNVAPLQKLDLGDTVTVIYPDLGVHVTKRIQNENWDSLVDRYTSMTLGDLREDIADVILDGVESYLGQISEYVDEVSTYFTTEINRTAYEISLKADASTVTTLGAVVAQNTAAITETSNAIEAEVTRAEGAESNLSTIISQKADSISISVNNSTDSATLTIGLYSGNDLVDSVTSSAIQFTGDIVFASDLVDGTTQISGNNITTGLISADRIDVDNLTVDKLVTKYNTNRALASSLTIRDGIIYQTSNPPSGRFDGTYIGMPLGSSVDLSGEYGVIMRVSESSYVSVSSTEVSMSTPGYLSVYISNNDLAVRIGTYLIECSKPIEINGYDFFDTAECYTGENSDGTVSNNEEIVGETIKPFRDKVILATGGKSYPGTGSTGDGYKLAEKLGHTVTKLQGSLVPLTSGDDICKNLQGLSLRNVGIQLIDISTNKEIKTSNILSTIITKESTVIPQTERNEENLYRSTELINDIEPNPEPHPQPEPEPVPPPISPIDEQSICPTKYENRCYAKINEDSRKYYCSIGSSE